MRRRPSYTSRDVYQGGEHMPERSYTARALGEIRQDWTCIYDVVGTRAIGSMFQEKRLVRRIFNVRINSKKFAVDIGTGSGVKIIFQDRRIPRSQ